MVDISKKLKNLRIKNNYTQGQIAQLCNVSRQAVAKWEAGTNLPDIEKILELSKLYKVSTDELLTGTSSPSRLSLDSEPKNNCAENEKIINQALERTMNCTDADEGINLFISYIGDQMGFDRMYIFEADADGNYKNTYEWCKNGIEAQIEYLQCIPLQDMSSWLNAFSTKGRVFIKNLDDIAQTDSTVYQWLKPQGIQSLLVYPLFGGRSFIGVDNPAPAFIQQTSTLIEILVHFIENMLQRRDLDKELKLAAFQNNQLNIFNKSVSYRINVLTGQVQYNKEQAIKAGYDFKADTLADLKAHCARHPEFNDHAMIDGYEKVVETKKNVSIEFVSCLKNKQLRWNRLTITPFLDSEGNILQIYGILQNISETHQIVEQYNRYIMNLSGGFHICYLSRPNHLEYASDSLCDFLGYTREEFNQVVGTKYINAMVEEDQPVFCAYFKRLTEHLGIESCKYRLIKKDGTVVSVIDTMESVKDSSGIIYGYAYILPENELRTMLEMSKENEEKQMSLINQQYAVIEALGKDYLNVFRVWLDEDKAQIFRLNGYITKGLDRNSVEYFSYNRICKQYIQDRVHPDDKGKMLLAMSEDTVRKAFSKSDEYTVIYRALEKGETHFYQLKYNRLQNEENNEKINFVAGFKNIDKFIEEQNANAENLQNKLNIINTIMQAFSCGYYMEYATDTFIELAHSDEKLSNLIGKSGHFKENREKMRFAFPDKKAFQEIDDFLNIETLQSRMNSKRSATTQVKIKDFGWYELYMFIVDYDEKGKVAHSIILAKNITDEKKNEAEYVHSLSIANRRELAAMQAAYIDALTGIMNRNAYERDYRELKEDSPVGFIYCDVNNLKTTNDRLGHKAGDELLLKFSRLLKLYFSADCIYRTGGDEFVCMIVKISEEKFSERVTKLTEAIHSENNIASIGSAHGNSLYKEHLVRQAEIQMYEMKLREHKNRK